MLTWDGEPIRSVKHYRDGLLCNVTLAPDTMPAHIRALADAEDFRWWCEDAIAEIRNLPEANVDPWWEWWE